MEQNYYDINAQLFFDETVNINLHDLYDIFLNCLGKNGHILDAGCGSGRDSRVFIDKGYRVTLFDSSREIVKLAGHYTDQQVRLMDFSQLDEIEIYDGIWCSASLLHMPESQLYNSMLLLNTALKKNGFMYISFKYGKGEYYKDGRHFTDMNEENINKLITNIDELVIIQTWTTPDKRPGKKDIWFNILLKKK